MVKQVPAGYSIDFRAFYSLQLDYSKLIGQSAQDKCQTAYKGLAIRQDMRQTTIFTNIQQEKGFKTRGKGSYCERYSTKTGAYCNG